MSPALPMIVGAVRVTFPANPPWLVRVTVAVPVVPLSKVIVVGLTLNPKSFTDTLSATKLDRVSGFPEASTVA